GGPAHGDVSITEDGKIAYTPDANYFGADSFTYTVEAEIASTVSLFTVTDTATVYVTVNPVNDAPTLSVPGAQTIAEDTNLTLGSVVVGDVDAAGNDIQVSLSAENGTLSLLTTVGSGLTADDIDGNGTGSVIVTGTLGQITTTLA